MPQLPPEGQVIELDSRLPPERRLYRQARLHARAHGLRFLSVVPCHPETYDPIPPARIILFEHYKADR